MVKEENKKIWSIGDKSEKAFLAKKAAPFDFSRYTKKDVAELVTLMRVMMIKHHGIGLAAPQIGIDARVFVAQMPSDDGKGYSGKFYAVFNPVVASISKRTLLDEEGCLSVPRAYGTVARAEKITIDGFDKNQRPITIKAEGFLARIFQHEVDHLNGILFINKTKEIYTIGDEPAAKS